MGLLDWFRLRTPKLADDGISDVLIRETTDYLVKMTDPRLAVVAGYRDRMQASVCRALEFVAESRDLMTPPREIATAAWSSDPCIKAFFVDPEELIEVFSRSTELRDFMAHSGGTEPVYAVLATEMEERKRLGIAIHEGMVVRDVAQITLNFTNHRLRLFGHSEHDLRQAVARRMLDELAMVALEQMQQERTMRKDLENSRALLEARRVVFEQRGIGVESFVSGAGHATASSESRGLLQQLEDNEQQLAALGGATDALERQLDYLCEVLMEPDEHISMERRQVRLDSMNVVVNAATAGEAVEFNVVRAERQAHIQHAMVPVQVDRHVIHELPRMSLDEAERLI